MNFIDLILNILFNHEIKRDEWPKEKKKKKKKAKKETPDWYTGEGVAMRERQVGDATFESQRMDKPSYERNTTLTDEEIELIEERGLDEVKAARVKPHWARGKSTAIAAGILKERGYGERTLDKYWAVFNLLSGEGLP